MSGAADALDTLFSILPIDPSYHKAEVSGPKQFKPFAYTIQYPVIEPLSAPDTSKTGRRFQQEHRCAGGLEGGAWRELYKPVGADPGPTPLRRTGSPSCPTTR